MPDVIVIGGGAAGLMAAGTALKSGACVTVIEKNEKCARKVMITGKGRCNVTNNTDLNGLIGAVNTNKKFLYSAFCAFSAYDTMSLFESLGVRLKTERGNRVFPASDKASDIVDALIKYASGAKFLHGEAKSVVTKDGKAAGVILSDGREVTGDKVILATGGISYPKTGSDGMGYKIAKELGHTVTDPVGSLVPLEIHEGFCEALMGLSLKNVSLEIYADGAKKPMYSDFGEMLFTHFGISGPMVLSASAHIKSFENRKYLAVIDLKPAMSEEMLDKRLLRDFQKYSNRDIINSLGDLLPRKLIPIVIKLSKTDQRKKVNEITKEERIRLISVIKGLKLHITGKRPVAEAIITCGGVSVKEIEPKTMESKVCKGLYFAGEVIDVDAYTGGYNLQIAFSTGYLSGKSSSEEK